ncbi:SHOCT domain-containing protein [Anaerofustis stercorihominis]|uniref:SHOCT domain-containing protein n=1 Tax=Anaerofustis stercorihominis TaxID=214853 RepID=UPI00267105BA|nr:SHOCT domain-containing protein [Anaerofustis stercorihominis]
MLNIKKHQDNDSNVSVNADDSISKVKKLKELLDIGAITKEEFENKKKDILGL